MRQIEDKNTITAECREPFTVGGALVAAHHWIMGLMLYPRFGLVPAITIISVAAVATMAAYVYSAAPGLLLIWGGHPALAAIYFFVYASAWATLSTGRRWGAFYLEKMAQDKGRSAATATRAQYQRRSMQTPPQGLTGRSAYLQQGQYSRRIRGGS